MGLLRLIYLFPLFLQVVRDPLAGTYITCKYQNVIPDLAVYFLKSSGIFIMVPHHESSHMMLMDFIKCLSSRSARSLASSHTPTLGSYISASSRGSGRSGPSFTLNQSSLDDEGLLASNGSRSPKNSKSTLRSVGFHPVFSTKPFHSKANSCSTKFVFLYFCNLQVAATVFVVVGLNYFHLHANNYFQTFDSTRVDSRASVLLTGRKVLQVTVICSILLHMQERCRL